MRPHTPRFLVATIATVIAGCAGRQSPPAPATPITIARIATEYRSYRQITDRPVEVNMQLALLCRGVNQRDVELAQAKHGPHAYAAIQVFMNAEAAAAMEAGKLRYPVGSVGKISSNPTYIIPMKQLASILAMAALAAFAAAAGTSSSDGDGSDFVIALSHPKTVAVSLPMPADYVSVQLRVSSDQKNAVAAHEESRQAIDAVVQKAKEGGQFKTTTGLVSLGQHASKFSMSSGSASSSPTGAEVFLLVPLQ